MRGPVPIAKPNLRGAIALPNLRGAIALFACALLLMIALDAALAAALAQQNPFGAPRPQPAAPAGGLAAWIAAKQAEYYRALSGAIRAVKTDWSALLVLFSLSFGYGVFHAAGPGHGKAVISSYLIANNEAWRRGVVLSFASAMLQAVVAVVVVGVGAVLLNATMCRMNQITDWIEIATYSLIAGLGAWLVWTKGRAFFAALGELRPRPHALGAAAAHDHRHHDHDHGDHKHADHKHGDHRHDRHVHGHDHDHGHHHHHDHVHGADCGCGHSHGPDPKDLAGPGGWRRGLSAIVAVGARPCSGAILILVFTFAQGILWAGIAATFVMALGTAITVAVMATLAVTAKDLAARYLAANSSYGGVVLRGVELGAAFIVLAFGALLLLGYMASERISTFGMAC